MLISNEKNNISLHHKKMPVNFKNIFFSTLMAICHDRSELHIRTHKNHFYSFGVYTDVKHQLLTYKNLNIDLCSIGHLRFEIFLLCDNCYSFSFVRFKDIKVPHLYRHNAKFDIP